MSGDEIKGDLLERIHDAHVELEAALAEMSDGEMIEPGVDSAWTAKDVLAHITFWEQRLLSDLAYYVRGEQPPTLKAPGESGPAMVERLNEANYRKNRRRELDDVRADFERSYKQLIAAIEALDPADVVPGGRLETVMGAALVKYCADDTYEHYLEHAGQISGWQASEEGTSA